MIENEERAEEAESVPCRLCGGSGRLPKPCEDCGGSGWVPSFVRTTSNSGGTLYKACPRGCKPLPAINAAMATSGAGWPS